MSYVQMSSTSLKTICRLKIMQIKADRSAAWDVAVDECLRSWWVKLCHSDWTYVDAKQNIRESQRYTPDRLMWEEEEVCNQILLLCNESDVVNVSAINLKNISSKERINAIFLD